MARKLSYQRLSNRNTRFFTFYMILLWVFIAILAGGWFYLRNTLSDYEAGQPGSRADAIAQEISGGDLSSLMTVLESTDAASAEAFRYSVASATTGAKYAATEVSSSNDTYSYNLTCNGVTVAGFTLGRVNGSTDWVVTSVTLNNDTLSSYAEHNAETQLELVISRIVTYDYSQLYSLMTPTGFVEDNEASFSAYMATVTPPITDFTYSCKESGSSRYYNLLASNQLFATMTMTRTESGSWQITAFDVADSIRNAYTVHLADVRANAILNLFTTGNTATIYSCCTANGYPAGAEEKFSAYLAPKLEGVSFTCSVYEVSGDDERSYRIDGDGTKYADFTIRRSLDDEGRNCWAVSDFSLPVWETVKVVVVAPSSFTIFADDKILGKDAILTQQTDSDVPEKLAQAHPDMVDSVTYIAEGAFDEPVLFAVDWNGRLATVTKESEGKYVCTPASDDGTLKEAHDQDVKAFCNSFSFFSMGDVSYSTMLQYVDSSSEAATSLRGYDTMWVKKHNPNSNSFYDFESANYIAYGDDMFSVDVTFKLSVVYTYGGKVEYTPSYRLYYEKSGTTWKVFAFVNTVE